MVVNLIAALVETAGYCMLMNVPRRLLAAASVGGMIGWGAYLLFHLWMGPTFSTVFATVIVVVLSRYAAVLM